MQGLPEATAQGEENRPSEGRRVLLSESRSQPRGFPESFSSPHATPRNDLAPKHNRSISSERRAENPHPSLEAELQRHRGQRSTRTSRPSQPPHHTGRPLVEGRGRTRRGTRRSPEGLNLGRGKAGTTGQGTPQMICAKKRKGLEYEKQQITKM